MIAKASDSLGGGVESNLGLWYKTHLLGISVKINKAGT